MTNHEHPIRKAELHTFARRPGITGGTPFIARFHPYDTWPIFFSGDTEDEAKGKAEKFRTETIEYNEQAYQNRMAGRDKARAAREAKKGEPA